MSILDRLEWDEDGLPTGWPADQGVETLGIGALAWGEAYLAQPDGDTAGRPWSWRMNQARFVAWWYAVDDGGYFFFRRGQIVLPKGAGKSPLAAALVCTEFGGPVVFSHWQHPEAPYGQRGAVGKRQASPVVQLAAIAESATDQTMGLVRSMLDEGDAHLVIPNLDPGIMRVRSKYGIIERLTASARSGEGKRPTFAALDETHHWITSNNGHELARVIRRNLGKVSGRSIETTNTWRPDEDSVAEQTYEFSQAMKEMGKSDGVLRWHPIAHVESLSDEEEVREALNKLYADSPWVDVERIIEEIHDPATPAADSRRFYLNEVVSVDDALVTDAEWKACADKDLRPLEANDTITLGFDGGKTDDATALVACRVEDRAMFVLGVWQKPKHLGRKDHWEVSRPAVDGTVREALLKYDVAAFYADVALWESYVDLWGEMCKKTVSVHASPNNAVAWDMRGRPEKLTHATEALVGGILDMSVKHNGDARLREHVLNTRRNPNRWGMSFRKESRESPKKVDLFAAMQLADMARYDFVQSGKKRRKRGKGMIVI